MAHKRPAKKDEPFVIRESIESSAGILLRVGKEIVGVMFVNYRRPHYFSAEEKKIVKTLASSAAIAIKNQRLLEELRTGEREIITTLDSTELLNLIVKRAVYITGARLGDIRRLDPISQTLVVQARYPADVPVDLAWSQLPIGEGITGWAAMQHQTILVNDITNDLHYIPYFPHMCAELCVPLLDGDRRLLGTLNVESDRVGAFDRKDKRMLEAFANHAVIAIQNADSQKRLTANETLATLGGLGSSLIHRMHNDVGAIRTRAQKIQNAEGVDAYSKRHAHRIEVLATTVVEEAKRLKGWTLDTPQRIQIRGVVDEAIKRVRIPQDFVTNIYLLDTLPQVLGGEQQLTEVFVNLIQNAVDAMVDKRGELAVRGESVTLEGKRWVLISVRDTGVGISEEEKDKIFQPNYSTKAKGLGFGLCWTRTYLDLLGGSITVQSQPMIATEFTLALPAWEQA
jgi:signal transduction histidine kinase